jgi:hypothetical protein
MRLGRSTRPIHLNSHTTTYILTVCDWLQMIGIYAMAHPTEMIKLKARGDRTT